MLDGGRKAEPLVKFRFGRDESDGGATFRMSGKTRDLVGLGDIDPALEWGGFAEYATGDFAGRVELRRGTGGHTGWVMDLSADYRQRVGGVFYALGSRLTLASRDFVQTYYGVNAGQSAASGLPVFGADGGLVSAGVGVRAFMPLGGNWRAGVLAGYDRLTGDAGDSPLVRTRGDEDQFSFVTSVLYPFR